MPIFPILKTGVAAQYPLQQEIAFSCQEVRFLDGTRQTYSLRAKALRKWDLRYEQLDESEAALLSHFVELYGAATFDFADPISGSTISNCRIGGSGVVLQINAEGNVSARVVVEESA